jgi:cell division protein FtsL
MIRTLNICLVMSGVIALVAVYALKFSVGDTAEQKVQLQRQIDRQEADLSLLKADWAFLNQPANVAPVVNRHVAELNLQTLSQSQFGDISILPMRLKAPDTNALDSLFQSLNSGVDPITQIIKEAN